MLDLKFEMKYSPRGLMLFFGWYAPGPGANVFFEGSNLESQI
jgi:hypothetical protein